MIDDHPHNRQHHNPERTARKTLDRALLRMSIVPAAGILLAIVVAIAALLLTVVAAASSLELLHGLAWLFAFAYLLAGPAAGVAALGKYRRILRTRRPTADVVTWKHTWSDLTDREEWLLRVGTAPLVPLAAVRLTALPVPTPLAVALATVGWLSIDLLTVVTVPSRCRLGHVLRLTHPRASGGYSR